MNIYNPSRGRLTSWWQRIQSVGRDKLVGAVTKEQIGVIEQGAVMENAVREGRTKEAELRVWVTARAMELYQMQVDEQLIENALVAGLTVGSHQQVLVAEKQQDLRLKEEDKLSVIRTNEADRMGGARVNEAKGMSGIKIGEHKQIKSFDVQMEYDQAMNTLAAISKFKHLQFEQFDEIRSRIIKLIEEEDRIENSKASPKVKGEQLEIIRETKQMYREILNAERHRFLEAGNWKAAEGIKSFTDTLGSSRQRDSAAREPIPVNKPRSGESR